MPTRVHVFFPKPFGARARVQLREHNIHHLQSHSKGSVCTNDMQSSLPLPEHRNSNSLSSSSQQLVILVNYSLMSRDIRLCFFTQREGGTFCQHTNTGRYDIDVRNSFHSTLYQITYNFDTIKVFLDTFTYIIRGSLVEKCQFFL